ncbi:MAG: undecaprenyl-diphosphate phosphatase [Bacteroidales bacterium]|nr:undecaprenyl-diphosphate phosphatase [Bacteroidales bacterium]
MNWFESLILGIVQGLTEYLPVSSSGHLAIGQALFGIDNGAENLTFTVMVHVATVLSTIVVFWREIWGILVDLFQWLRSLFVHDETTLSEKIKNANEGTRYSLNILISMIPIGIVGFTLKDKVESVFGSGLLVVGFCLLVTSFLLSYSYFANPRQRENISPLHALIIGCAQALAVLPGLSRSGSTIATGMLLGNKKEKLAQFSFLMVIPPILGEALLDTKDMLSMGISNAMAGISPSVLLVGFVAAFVSGLVACRWMVNIVKKGKLIWFALYCAVVGIAVMVLA